MHDLSYFRENLDVFANMAKRRGITLDLDAFRALDKERREFITTNEQRKAQRNKASDEIARLKKEKQNADAIIAEMKQLSDLIKQTDEKVAELDTRQRELLLTIPNLPHSSVPAGTSSADNVEVRRWGTAPKFDFQPKPHWEVGEQTGILDLEAATKITGARFAVYKSWGARLERAIANFFLDVHTREHGYTEILPPFLVNTASWMAAGKFPNLRLTFSRFRTPISGSHQPAKWNSTICIVTKQSRKTSCRFTSRLGPRVFAPKRAPREKIRAGFCGSISFRKWSCSSLLIRIRVTKSTRLSRETLRRFCKNSDCITARCCFAAAIWGLRPRRPTT